MNRSIPRTAVVLTGVLLIAVLLAGGLLVARWAGPAAESPAAPPVLPSSSGVPSEVTVAAVGDLVCDPEESDADGRGGGRTKCRQREVSDLLVARRPAAFLALGDTQYDDGTLSDFRANYAPTYGRLLDVTYPVPGNHEYRTAGAAGYYDYFGRRAGPGRRGYYSFDLGEWHLVALNSNCQAVSCSTGSEQERWLRADLAAHPARCTLAFWHHPRWSHGEHGDDPAVAPLVQALHDAGAELILTGHDHDYERFTPRAAEGSPDPAGVRQFVVGTGGRNLRDARAGAGTEAIDDDSFGALFLTLTPTAYHWQFVPVGGGGPTDSGTTGCH